MGGRELEIFSNMQNNALMQQAQIQLMKSQAKNIDADTSKKLGVDTEETQANINKLNAQTKSEQLNAAILSWNEMTAEVQANVAKETEADQLETIREGNKKLRGEADSALAKGEVDQATYDEIIKQTEQATTEQQVRIAAAKAGIINTQTNTAAQKQGIEKMIGEIVNMKEDIRAKWREWAQRS